MQRCRVLSIYRHREELAARLEAQERAFEQVQKKQQEELKRRMKPRQISNKETKNLISFLLRTQATQATQ